MKKTLTQYDIANELMQDTNANWSRAGAFALAEYFEEIEMETNEEMDFDAVAIRCDFSEYSSLRVFLEEYFSKALSAAIDAAGIKIDDMEEEDELDEAIRSYIQDHGQLIEFDGGIIVSSF